MPCSPLPADQQADAEALAQAIREAIAAEIDELARTLVATADSHPFGATEFKVRALVHQVGAKALEQHLAQKKRLRRGQRDLPALRPAGGVPRLPPAHADQPRRTRPL
jgi:hypothetical protein